VTRIAKQAHRLAGPSPDRIFCFEIQMHGLEPPSSGGATGEQVLGQVKEERLLGFSDGDARRAHGQDAGQRFVHRHVLGAVHAVGMAQRGDALHRDLVVRV
jgi:hypothetical protein